MSNTRANVRYLKSGHPDYDAEIVLAYDFPDALIEGRQGGTALNIIWRQCNRVDGQEWISTSGLKTRSLSCGDIVTLDGKIFLIESFTRRELNQEQADWIIENITGRDWMHDLEDTLKFMKDIQKKDIKFPG
jgi:hypothetical protein